MSSPNRYEDSFGNALSDLKGQKRWSLAGTAEALWKRFQPRISEMIVAHRDRIYKGYPNADVVKHCWMLGPDQTNAIPSIALSSNISRIVYRAARVIKEHGKMVREAGFSVELLQIDQITLLSPDMGEGEGLGSDDTTDPPNLCGRRILAAGSRREATLGGIINLDGVSYGLTVAHAFFKIEGKKSSDMDHRGLIDYDLDSRSDDEFSSDNEDLLEDMDAKQQSTPQESPAPSINFASEGVDCILQNNSVVNFPVSTLADQNFHDAMKSGDWALVDIPRDLQIANKFSIQDQLSLRTLYVEEFMDVPCTSQVYAILHGYNIRGFSAGPLSHVTFQGAHDHCRLWPVQFDEDTKGRLPEVGDSGAWVVDANSGALCGMLVAESKALGIHYVMPLEIIKDNIIKQMEAKDMSLPPGFLRLLRLAVDDDNIKKFQDLIDNKIQEPSSRLESPKHMDDFKAILRWASDKSLTTAITRIVTLYEPCDSFTNEWRKSLGIALLNPLQAQNLEAAEVLIDRGADVEVRYNGKRTVLSFAAEKGHTLMAQLLLQHGAQVNSTDISNS